MLERARTAAFMALARTRRFAPYLLHTYDYMFLPSQLGFLAAEVERTEAVEGSLLEVGCALGATTIFLDQHLRTIGSPKRYFALDTFSGFPPDDIEVEQQQRGRTEWSFANFRRNSQALFERTMRINGASRVTAITADAKTFDYSTIGPFSFCLVDVDLYQPVRATLEAVHGLMSPGGVIVIDDCDRDHPMWRGGYEAYVEFVGASGLPEDIRFGKLGVIEC